MRPDGWEIANGFDPNDPTDHIQLALGGPGETGPGLVRLSASVVGSTGECTVAWSQTAGPETVALHGTPGPTPSFIARKAGTYSFRATATCATGTGAGTLRTTIRNVPPLVAAGGMRVVAPEAAVTLDAVDATATPRSYRVLVSQIAPSDIHYAVAHIHFQISHDAGATWPASGYARAGGLGSAVNLDDGTKVQVRFPQEIASYAQNDAWRFWIGYPLLQTTNASDAMCEDCHRTRVHSSTRVEGGDAGYPANGTNKFSHPVNETLNNDNRHPYDRTLILDANGVATAQGSDSDSNATNNLRLDSAAKVRCTTCHYVHNADSNSLTVDPR